MDLPFTPLHKLASNVSGYAADTSKASIKRITYGMVICIFISAIEYSISNQIRTRDISYFLL